MDLNRAAIFAQVVDSGGFSAAGRRLGIPKTTISKKVSDLEAELGVRLLNRTTRSVSLTEAGARLHAHCEQALRQLDLAEREMQALLSEPEGLLRVGAPSAIGVRFLLPIIADLMARYPALRVSLVAVNDNVGGIDDSLDVLIWPGALRQNAHALRLVAAIEIGLFATQGYLDAVGTPQVPSALERHAVIAFTQSLVDGRFAWDLTRGRTTVRVVPEVHPRFLSNDAVAVMAAISAGQGVGGLPVNYVNQAPEGATLVRVLPEWRAAQIELNAFYRDGNAMSAKTRIFLDCAARWFQQ